MYYIVYRPSINKVNISRLFLCILSAVRTPCLARRRKAAPPGCASGTGPLMRLLFYVFWSALRLRRSSFRLRRMIVRALSAPSRLIAGVPASG